MPREAPGSFVVGARYDAPLPRRGPPAPRLQRSPDGRPKGHGSRPCGRPGPYGRLGHGGTGHTTSAMLNGTAEPQGALQSSDRVICAPLDQAIPEFRGPILAGQAIEDEKGPDKGPDSPAEVAEWQTRRIQNPLSARV
jgi:hypothetical protein